MSQRYDWRDVHGNLIDCAEKCRVLDDTMAELEQQCRDVLDDALLMGCAEKKAKQAMQQLISTLTPTVKERN